MRRTGLSLKKLKLHSIKTRKSLCFIKDFSKPVKLSKYFPNFFSCLPNIYAGKDIKGVIKAIAGAFRNKKMVVFAMGAHVIKCGLSPLVIDLIKRRIIKAVALNGGGAIHDFEISFAGKTSEDVKESITSGSFGMAKETLDSLTRAAKAGSKNQKGLGQALGEINLKNRFARFSILAQAVKYKIPATVHVAIGTDIAHIDPSLSGKDLGESTLIDFRKITEVVAQLQGGVWLNIGSAVILPEVFLKALSIARNLGYQVKDFTAVNLDIIQHYRPAVNVLQRPEGRAIAITGHHEILIPLIWAGVVSEITP
jgi:deoxyhypusine synthase